MNTTTSTSAAYSWSASTAAEKSREKRASGLYTTTPLEKMKISPQNSERKSSTTMVNQIQDMLIIDDDEIFEIISEEEEEDEEDFTDLPPTTVTSTTTNTTATKSSSDTNNKKYINSIRKTRPLPKIPDRASSKELPNNMTQVFSDNFRNQNKLIAQQLFQLMSKSIVDAESDEEDDSDEENYGGVYAIKTQIPSEATLSKSDNISPYHHHENYNANYYKMMTPVEEVEEEDQLYKTYEEEVEEEKEKEGEMSPNLLLEPIDNSSLSPSNSSNLRSSSQISLSAPSLTSGRTSPSSHNSRQSMEITLGNDQENVDTHEESNNEAQPQQQHNIVQYNQRQYIQPQHRDLQESDLINDINNSLYEFQEPFQFYSQHNNSTDITSESEEDVSLLSDVKRLSQLNQALMTPLVSNSEINPVDHQQAHQQLSPSSDDYINVNTNSPLAMTSFSLTHNKESIKTYHRMATKTKDKNIQFTFAKYLLQLVSFYSNNSTNMNNNGASSKRRNNIISSNSNDATSTTRDQLQEEAEYWIEKLAKSNHAEALYIKGQWHKHCCDKNAIGLFIGSQYKKANHAKALKCFQQAAKFGFTEAHYELADYWIEHKEYKKAISSYRYAASKDHFLSLYKLANIMLRGLLNQEKDIRQGLIYLKKAADTNTVESARSAYDLACIYSNDLETIGLDRNTIVTPSISNQTFGHAVYYYKKADALGLIAATFRLGYIFEYGHLNTEANPWEAYKCYSKAAEKGHESAMLELSRLYKDGIPGYLNASVQMAHNWCLRATENGNEIAEYTMGNYHELGVGTRLDYSQALVWYNKAASKGYGPAETKLNVPSNKRVSMISRRLDGGEEKKAKNQQIGSNKNKKYYEESVHVAEKSRKSTQSEENCQIM